MKVKSTAEYYLPYMQLFQRENPVNNKKQLIVIILKTQICSDV
jgi:hypothetical protein